MEDKFLRRRFGDRINCVEFCFLWSGIESVVMGLFSPLYGGLTWEVENCQ